MRFKVLTLNTWFCKFLPEIHELIKSHDPDAIFLQEVTSGIEVASQMGASNGYEQLRQAFPEYFTCYTPMWRVEEGDEIYWNGLALMSKQPFINTHAEYYYGSIQTFIPGGPFPKFPGVYLEGKISVAGQIITLVDTHFLWSLHPEITQSQKEAMTILKEHLVHKINPIIAGDFNITDDSEIYKMLVSDFIDDRPAGTTRTLHPTIHKVGTQKDLAVDYVFHKADILSLVSSVVPLVPASDHLPIIVEYEIGN